MWLFVRVVNGEVMVLPRQVVEAPHSLFLDSVGPAEVVSELNSRGEQTTYTQEKNNKKKNRYYLTATMWEKVSNCHENGLQSCAVQLPLLDVSKDQPVAMGPC